MLLYPFVCIVYFLLSYVCVCVTRCTMSGQSTFRHTCVPAGGRRQSVPAAAAVFSPPLPHGHEWQRQLASRTAERFFRRRPPCFPELPPQGGSGPPVLPPPARLSAVAPDHPQLPLRPCPGPLAAPLDNFPAGCPRSTRGYSWQQHPPCTPPPRSLRRDGRRTHG